MLKRSFSIATSSPEMPSYPVAKRARRVPPKAKRAISKLYKSMTLKSINNTIVPAVHCQSVQIPLSTTTGWNSSTVFSLQWAFSQNNAFFAYGGTTGTGTWFSSTTYGNAPQYAGIYDMYRIKKVEIDLYYSDNTSSNSNNVPLPMIYGVIDYDDGNTLGSATTALSFSTCKVMQLGNQNGSPRGLNRLTVLRPCVKTSVDTTSFVSTQKSAKIDRSPWLDTDTVNVEHYGAKYWFENPGGTPNTNDGICTFIIRQFMEYKISK
jgi:hypothetical protein